MLGRLQPARLLRPLHRWIWRDAGRRARKLLRFADTEAAGGRDIARAAELTADPALRRLLLRHAVDEGRHAALFGARGRALQRARPRAAAGLLDGDWLAPGERGLEGGRVEALGGSALLAFLHLSERTAARRFAVYRDILAHDPATRAVFDEVLRDEEFHMTYTKRELGRVAPRRRGLALWRARASRLWRAYLRLAVAVAGLLGGVILTAQYFLLVPPFALLAKRAARREAPGWRVRGDGGGSLESQT
jgi:hypothetical protein